jgi:hypothetical protein
MTRKDSEKEAERPHYYSQFWLDVAAGRRVIGGPKPGEENEVAEQEPVEPVSPRKAGRISSHSDHGSAADGRRETVVHPASSSLSKAQPLTEPDMDEELELEPDEMEMVGNDTDVEELDFQNLDVEDADIPDMDLSPLEEEEEEEDLFEEEEEEEEEWSRGRKKPKITRPPKPSVRRSKRERRNY